MSFKRVSPFLFFGVLTTLMFVSRWVVEYVSAAEIPAGVFQMASGIWYQPSTGRQAATLDELLNVSTSTSVEMLANPPAVESTDTTTSTMTPTTTVQVLPMKLAIQRGRELLLDGLAQVPTSSRIVTKTTDDEWRDVVIAVWNLATDAVRTIAFRKHGSQIVLANPQELGDIQVIKSKGVATEYDLRNGEIVVAVRYPFVQEVTTKKQVTKIVKGKKKSVTVSKTTYTFQDVVYSPYSSDLYTPEMIAEGKKWFVQTLQRAYADLQAQGVRSKAFPGKLLSEVIPADLVASILFTEHSTDAAVTKNPDAFFNAMAVIFAANEKRAFAYTVSSVGARGLGQFMPATYARLAKRPELNLPTTLEGAAHDIESQMRAEVALLDAMLAELPAEARRAMVEDRPLAYEYLAASYNGGQVRVSKAMKVWEANLDPVDRKSVRQRSRLAPETMYYVLRMRKVLDAYQQRFSTEEPEFADRVEPPIAPTSTTAIQHVDQQ